MIHNIAIFGFDRNYVKKVCLNLSQKLEMFYIDTIELFEFDNLPHTLTDMLNALGMVKFRQKEVGSVEYVSNFSNTVISFDTGAIKRQTNIKTIRDRCELVYLQQDTNKIKEILSRQKYASAVTKKFFDIPLKAIDARKKILEREATICVKVARKSPEALADEIIQKIQKKYENN